MKIVIPDHRGPSWNDFYSGGHWSKRKDAKDIAHQLVRAAIDPNVTPFNCQVDIYTTVYFASKPQDSDNICDKLFNDALKGWVIREDDKRYVRWAATRAEVDKDNPRVEIEVVPVET
jgi:Holliday junction resolvase RusA-like endonuclease